MGVWLQRDPLGYADGPNLYAYYPGVNGTDPWGEEWDPWDPLGGGSLYAWLFLEPAAEQNLRKNNKKARRACEKIQRGECLTKEDTKWEDQNTAATLLLVPAQACTTAGNGLANGVAQIPQLPLHGYNGIVWAEVQMGILPEGVYDCPTYQVPKNERGYYADLGGTEGGWDDTERWIRFGGELTGETVATGGIAYGAQAVSKTCHVLRGKNLFAARGSAGCQLPANRTVPRFLDSTKLGREQIENFRGGSYTVRVLEEDEVFFRYHDLANRQGYRRSQFVYLTPDTYNSEYAVRMGNAILPQWKSDLVKKSVIRVPKGTRIAEGCVAPQTSFSGKTYPGGDWQVLIEYMPKAWVEQTHTVPWRVIPSKYRRQLK